jgi:hypothetical protein
LLVRQEQGNLRPDYGHAEITALAAADLAYDVVTLTAAVKT